MNPKLNHNSHLVNRQDTTNALIKWYDKNARKLPWRISPTHSKNGIKPDPYKVWISEIMLQQTGVKVVQPYFTKFINNWPDINCLNKAKEADVLALWSGLGYYRRARNLKACAEILCTEYQGHFPADEKLLLKLPGIGKYTAGAIASFAFNSSVPAVDANIARVIVRIFDFQERIDTSYGQKKIWGWANDMVPSSGARSWNSALMELGQTLCKPRVVLCDECPLSACCQSSQPLDLPIKKSKPQMTSIDEHVILAVSKSKVLLEQEKGRRRHGMWKLPARDGKDLKETKLLSKQKYGITRYKMTMHIYQSDNPCARENEQWFKMNELQSLPMPSPYRRALKLINEVSAQEN